MCLRVLQTFTQFSMGGVPRHIRSLSKWLRNNGHEVWIGGELSDGKQIEDPRFAIDLPLSWITGRKSFSPRSLGAFLISVRRLRRFVQTQNINLVHAHEIAPAMVAWFATFKSGIPVVLTAHGCEDSRWPRVARVGGIFASQWIAVSEHAYSRLVRFGTSSNSIARISYGIDSRNFPGEQTLAANLRTSLLGSNGRSIVICVARLHRQKGIDILVKAAHSTYRRHPGVRFVIVGDGPLRDNIQSQVHRLGLSEIFYLVGEYDNPQTFLLSGDVFVLPSRWEGLPIVIPEAFRAGLPVVASDAGGIPEIVDSSVGIVVPKEDAEGLASALIELLENDEKRFQLSNAASIRGGLDRFNPDHVHSEIAQLYISLVNRKREKTCAS